MPIKSTHKGVSRTPTKASQRSPRTGPNRKTKAKKEHRSTSGRQSSSSGSQRKPGAGPGKGSPGRPRKRRTAEGTGSVPSDSRLALARNAAGNMLTLLGGTERVVELLADSTHPKAQKLIDRLRDSQYLGENFALSYSSVGLKAPDIVEIFGDVQQARTFISALSESGEVMMSLVRAAKDQLEEHDRCDGTGRKLDSKGKATDVVCSKCRGTGYLLKSGARDAQELYFELIKWKQGGGMNLNIDNRRQQVNVGGGGVHGVLPGQAPEALSIVKRADQVRGDYNQPPQLPAAAQGPADAPETMPEDVLEAEPV